MPQAEIELRKLSFENMDEIVADIEQLAGGEVKTMGGHSFAAIVDHLAKTNEMLLGRRQPPKLPWMYRLAMPFLRKKILNSKPTPGFKLPSSELESFFWDDDADLSDAIAYFKSTTEECKNRGMPDVHPFFGPATPQQIENLVLNHAAMHLSFVMPA